MRRLLSFLLILGLLAGCGRSAPQPVAQPNKDEGPQPHQPHKPDEPEKKPDPIPDPVRPPQPSAQDRYDAALQEALQLLARRQYPQALTAFKTARGHQDTEQARQEIERL